MGEGPIYFGGSPDDGAAPAWKPTAEWLHTEEAFFSFIATVWSKDNPIPNDPAALAAFDLAALRPVYDAFLASGGRLEPRGTTVEEQWVLMQLGLRRPVSCLLNEAHADQPVDRIEDVEMLPVEEIWTRLLRWYENKALATHPDPDRPARMGPTCLLVYDGRKVAHVITAQTIWNGELHYLDPWPGRSLLCAENNAAGVAARESDLIVGHLKEPGGPRSRPGWRITAQEFLSVGFAVFLFEPPRRGELARPRDRGAQPDG
ncbi:MAG: hypothetical protein ABI647_12605 [Gemmatimonadota bacterium]